MKRYGMFIGLAVFIIVAVIAVSLVLSQQKADTTPQTSPTAEPTIQPTIMKLTSPAFHQGGTIPQTYTCDGDDVNPAITITDVPAKTKSLALIVDDPDAPAGTWNHWLLWNIDPSTTKVDENRVPTGAVEGTNDFGKTSYGGPCPPSGTHRYFFRLYALDNMLNLTAGAKRAALDAIIADHIIAEAQLMGTYSRE